MEIEENPLYSNSIIPRSLCMRQCICDYCGQTNTKSIRIEYLFGILTCNEHYLWGKRDCNSYMHISGIVHMKDAIQIPEISEFINMITVCNYMFPIVRTSGILQTGWMLVEGMYESITRINNIWHIHLYNDIEHIYKYIPITYFLENNVIQMFPLDFSKYLVSTLRILEEGVYVKDFQKQPLNAKEVVDAPCISKIMVNGQVVRVLL